MSRDERTSAPVNISLGPAMTHTCASISRSRVIESLLLHGWRWGVRVQPRGLVRGVGRPERRARERCSCERRRAAYAVTL